MKRMLAIDTSSKICSVSYYEIENEENKFDFKNIYEINKLDVKTHAKELMPTVDKVLKENNITIDEIDTFGITIGPGSFTGIRIGISTVKGFTFLTNKNVIEITSLENIARTLDNNITANYDYVVTLIDGKNEQSYYGLYKVNNLDYSINNKEKLVNYITIFEKAININDLTNHIQEDIDNSKFKNKNGKENIKILIAGDSVKNYNELIIEIIKNSYLKANNNIKYELYNDDIMQHSSGAIKKYLIDSIDEIVDNKEYIKTSESILPKYLKITQAQKQYMEKNKN